MGRARRPPPGPVLSSPPPPSQLYENFVEEIDAIDNGIAQWDGEPRYAMTTNLSARVANLNPRWNDTDQDTEVGTWGRAEGKAQVPSGLHRGNTEGSIDLNRGWAVP